MRTASFRVFEVPWNRHYASRHHPPSHLNCSSIERSLNLKNRKGFGSRRNCVNSQYSSSDDTDVPAANWEQIHVKRSNKRDFHVLYSCTSGIAPIASLSRHPPPPSRTRSDRSYVRIRSPKRSDLIQTPHSRSLLNRGTADGKRLEGKGGLSAAWMGLFTRCLFHTDTQR